MKSWIVGTGYLLIGIVFWLNGFLPSPTIKENIFTFIYISVLWPFVIGSRIIHNLISSMSVNYLAILACAVLSMAIGALWYGPLFGKKWLEIIGATTADLEARKKMQQRAMPLYGVQFVLTLFQVWVLAYYIQGWADAPGVVNALWIWAAFIIPVIAGTAMWNNDSAKVSWARFLIQGGYQLVIFIMFGLVLGYWQ